MPLTDVAIVGGCGHVGLPFGLVLANVGLKVALIDSDEERASTVRAGRMPFLEHGADDLLASTLGRTLSVVDGLDAAVDARWIVITIGTPVDDHLSPRLEPLFDLFDELAPKLGAEQTIVLRSTVFPGTTRELARRLEGAGCQVGLAYCPERIAQGFAITELDKLPQIVSGVTPEATDSALELFHHVTTRTLVVDPEEAELAKLFLNSWRYIQFAIANQFFMMAEERGLDFNRIHEAMTDGYERGRDFPRAGFTAGPCLLKDTLQLAASDRTRFPLGQAAMMVNEGLADFVVARLAEQRDLEHATVGILGMAFKRNVDDTRESLAFRVRKLLTFRGARVLATDPLARDESFVPLENVLAESDVLVIGAPHDAYRELQIPNGIEVVDVWGFLR